MPPRRYVPFLVASLFFALTFGFTLGAMNLARLTGTWGWLPRSSVWVHGYVQAFGFFALFIMGFACHAVPRFLGAPLGQPRLVTAALWLQVGGVASLAAGFLFLPALVRPLWIAGTSGLVAAGASFLTSLLATLRHRQRPPGPFERWMVAGACWLVAGAVLSLVAALQDDIAWHHVLWPVMLYGFTASWILGAGRRLFPLSLGWQPRWPRLEMPAFLLYMLGVAGWSLGAWPIETAGRAAARAVGAVALLVSMPLFAAILGLGGPRQPWAAPGIERDYERYVRAGWAWLFVGLALGPAWTLSALVRGDYGSLTMLDFSRHTIALGFATQLIMSIGGRFVPAFTGTRLWSPLAHQLAFWLLNLAVAVRALEAVLAVGYWPGTWPWLALAGPPAVAALLLFAVNLLAALWPRRPTPFRPAGADLSSTFRPAV